MKGAPAFIATVALVVMISACSSKTVLNREKAEAMIRASAAFTSGPAPRVLKSVTGVALSGDGKTATVDFEWYFEDVKDMPMGIAGVSHHSTAQFKLYDDGWRVDERALAESVFASGSGVPK